MNQFNKIKDFMHGNLSKNDRQILSPSVMKEEKHVDNIKTILTGAEKKLTNSLLSGAKYSESEKKQKKLPSTSLNKFFNEASEILSSSKNDSVLSKTLLTCSQLQNEFTQITAEYESNVEEHCLDEIKKYLNEDLPSIHRTRKQLNKANEDLKQAKTKYESFIKTINNASQINTEMFNNKSETLKKEVDYCEHRLEQCKDAYEIELFDFLGKELTISEIFYKYIKILEVHHDRMLKEVRHCIPVLEGVLKNSTQKPVFGVALEEHLRASGRKISVVIEKCVEYLRPFIKEEGLFRISGSVSKVKRMRNAFNAGRLEAVNELKTDAAAVVSTLKGYLRELPEPLLTFKLNPNWFEATKETDPNKRLQEIWKVCNMLPEANKNNLCYLLKFLNELTKYKDLNKMSSQNLAIALGPSLLWSKGDSYDLSMSNHLPTLVEALIAYCDYFFPDEYYSELTNSKNMENSLTSDNNNYNSDAEIISAPTTPNQQHRILNSNSNSNKKKQPAPKPPQSQSPVPSSSSSSLLDPTNSVSPTGSVSGGTMTTLASTSSKIRSKIGSFKIKSKPVTVENVKNIFNDSQPKQKSPSPPTPRDENSLSSPSSPQQIFISTTTTSVAPTGSTAIYLRKQPMQTPDASPSMNHHGHHHSSSSGASRNRPKSICERPMIAPPSIPVRPVVAPKPETSRKSSPALVSNNTLVDKYPELNHIDSEPEENSLKDSIDGKQQEQKVLIEFEQKQDQEPSSLYPSLDNMDDSDDQSILTPPPPRKPPRAHSSTNSTGSSSSNLSLNETATAQLSHNNNNNDNGDLSKLDSVSSSPSCSSPKLIKNNNQDSESESVSPSPPKQPAPQLSSTTLSNLNQTYL